MQKHHTTRCKFMILDGTLIPIVSGGADDGDGDGSESEEDGEDEGDDSSSESSKKPIYTQERMDQKIAAKVGQAQRRARQEFAKELGYDSVEAMRAALAAPSGEEAEASAKLAKREADLARKEAKADQTLAEAAQARLLAKIEARLVMAGANPNKVEKIASMLDLKPDDEPDKDDIDEAIVSFRVDWAELFSQDEGEGDAPSGTPPASDIGKSKTKKPQGSAQDRAKARFAERHPEVVSKTG